MPTAALRPCAGRCGARVARGRCDRCKTAAWAGTQAWDNPRQAEQAPRLRGRALQRARAALFAREPLCRMCLKQGRGSVAVIRDHVLALAHGGEESEENVQPLCQACSDAKTACEGARGRAGVSKC